MSTTRITGKDAWHTAERKARYGGKCWIAWLDKNGVRRADHKNYETIKEAMLQTGTQGNFRFYDRNGAMLVTWEIASIMLRNSKRYL